MAADAAATAAAAATTTAAAAATAAAITATAAAFGWGIDTCDHAATAATGAPGVSRHHFSVLPPSLVSLK